MKNLIGPLITLFLLAVQVFLGFKAGFTGSTAFHIGFCATCFGFCSGMSLIRWRNR